MTENQFIFAHKVYQNQTAPSINSPYRININCSENPPYIISGVTITDNAYRTLQGSEITGTKSLLAQIEQIRIRIGDTPYTLKIISRNYYPLSDTVHAPFFYYRVEPVNLGNTLPTSSLDRQYVLLEPLIEDTDSYTDQYSAVLNNITDNRQSDIHQISERSTSSGNPTNILSLISGSGAYSTLQDSTYSDTGWINARYNGSKTSEETYKGIPANFTARIFTGETHSSNLTDSLINTIPSSDRVYKEYLHTGEMDLPTFLTSSLEVYVKSGSLKADSFEYVGTLATESLSRSSISKGDLLLIGSESPLELVRVNSIDVGVTEGTIVGARGYMSTPKIQAGGTSVQVYKILKDIIYETDGNSSKIKQLSSKKIYLKDTRNIVYLDNQGAIYSSSIATDDGTGTDM